VPFILKDVFLIAETEYKPKVLLSIAVTILKGLGVFPVSFFWGENLEDLSI